MAAYIEDFSDADWNRATMEAEEEYQRSNMTIAEYREKIRQSIGPITDDSINDKIEESLRDGDYIRAKTIKEVFLIPTNKDMHKDAT